MRLSFLMTARWCQFVFCGFLVVLFITGCRRVSGYSLQHQDFKFNDQLRWEKDSSVLVLSSNYRVYTRELPLKKGKYCLILNARGTQALNVLPHLQIKLDNFFIRDINVPDSLQNMVINFEVLQDRTVSLVFEFDNDYSSGTEDRNIFLYMPVIIKSF